MRRRLTGVPSADEGFSLVEVVTVTMLMGVILAAAYGASQVVNSVSDGIMARSAAQEQGQLALEKMVRELRQAQVTSDGKRFYPNASASSVNFYTDIDHDGYVERISYYISNADLFRTVARSNLAAPSSAQFGADSTPVKLVDLDPSDSTVFTYWDDSVPPVQIDGNNAFALQISLTAAAKSGNASATVTFPSTWVEARAIKDIDQQ